MTDTTEDYKDMPLVAAVAETPKHESRVRMDQKVQREVQDAMERKELEIAAALQHAGVPINDYPNTPEGAEKLAFCLKVLDIEIQKLVYQDDFSKSGYYIYKAGEQVGFVPCEIVRGTMI